MELQPSDKNHGKLLQELCNFTLLVVLDHILLLNHNNNTTISNKKDDYDNDDPMEQLCEWVKRYARGQKKGTTIPNNLQLLLQHVLQ